MLEQTKENAHGYNTTKSTFCLERSTEESVLMEVYGKKLRAGLVTGFWSRRIDQEHRLVYKVEGNCIRILVCRYHY